MASPLFVLVTLLVNLRPAKTLPRVSRDRLLKQSCSLVILVSRARCGRRWPQLRLLQLLLDEKIDRISVDACLPNRFERPVALIRRTFGDPAAQCVLLRGRQGVT